MNVKNLPSGQVVTTYNAALSLYFIATKISEYNNRGLYGESLIQLAGIDKSSISKYIKILDSTPRDQYEAEKIAVSNLISAIKDMSDEAPVFYVNWFKVILILLSVIPFIMFKLFLIIINLFLPENRKIKITVLPKLMEIKDKDLIDMKKIKDKAIELEARFFNLYYIIEEANSGTPFGAKLKKAADKYDNNGSVIIY